MPAEFAVIVPPAWFSIVFGAVVHVIGVLPLLPVRLMLPPLALRSVALVLRRSCAPGPMLSVPEFCHSLPSRIGLVVVIVVVPVVSS